ncbi:hypothetical protein [Paraburkholderia rhynchosiae]|nr:hypothetical protein [Paraburkholderia rhynchosiae]PMS22206.1 hypothetical protein C0Z16_33090 [Paraburkholderia rhynchosiae]
MPFNKAVTNVLHERHRESALSFDLSNGRLRYFHNERLVVELLPPNSWTFVATVASNSHWGTRPSQEDLLAVLSAFRNTYLNPYRRRPQAEWFVHAFSTSLGSLDIIRKLGTRWRTSI